MAKYIVNTDVPANVPYVHLHLKPGADHQQSLPDDVDEEQLHHHDEHGPLRHQDQQIFHLNVEITNTMPSSLPSKTPIQHV